MLQTDALHSFSFFYPQFLILSNPTSPLFLSLSFFFVLCMIVMTLCNKIITKKKNIFLEKQSI